MLVPTITGSFRPKAATPKCFIQPGDSTLSQFLLLSCTDQHSLEAGAQATQFSLLIVVLWPLLLRACCSA